MNPTTHNENAMATKSFSFLLSLVLYFLTFSSCGSYCWRARVDRTKGLAYSVETSQIKGMNENKRTQLVDKLFASYPVWLCRPSVSFGLLRCVEIKNGWEIRFLRHCALRLGKTGSRNRSLHQFTIAGGFLTARESGHLSFHAHEDGYLETHVDRYCPQLCGEAPVPLFRAAFYRSTQSILHAYVMWRFHRYCRQSVAST